MKRFEDGKVVIFHAYSIAHNDNLFNSINRLGNIKVPLNARFWPIVIPIKLDSTVRASMDKMGGFYF